jgi:hypothetical protein
MSLRTFALLMLIIALSIPVGLVVSQTSSGLESGFNQALLQVRSAEAAGATPSELSSLVVSLNKALQLNEQAMRLTDPASSQQRAQLLKQVDQILGHVHDNALALQVTASDRTSLNLILAYVGGGVAAVLGTLAYALSLSLWRRYRVKRTLQMKLKPK